MLFDLNAFRAAASEIEKRHRSFFENAGQLDHAVSIHNFYYVYYRPQSYYLRFTVNSGLPELIKEEIKTAYERFRSGSLS